MDWSTCLGIIGIVVLVWIVISICTGVIRAVRKPQARQLPIQRPVTPVITQRPPRTGRPAQVFEDDLDDIQFPPPRPVNLNRGTQPRPTPPRPVNLNRGTQPWPTPARPLFPPVDFRTGGAPRTTQEFPPAPPAGGGMVIKRFKPGRRPAEPGAAGHTGENPFQIDLPAHVTIYQNQQKCIVCQDSILKGDSREGWARCLATNKLVHGGCQTYAARDNIQIRNWCVVCNGPCQSGQGLRIEGRYGI